MGKIRVARLIDVYGEKFMGGGQTHVRELSHALLSHDCESVLFSQSNPHIVFRFLWSGWVIGQVLASHIRRPFHLVHSHGFIAGFSAKVISLILRIPVVHSIHGTPNMEQQKGGFMERLEKFLLLDIPYDAQITDGKKFFDFTPKTKEVVYIPNGVRLSTIHASQAGNSKKPAIILITVARLVKEKGIDILLQAVSRLKNPFIELRVLGAGPLAVELKQLAKQLHIDSQIKWLGVKKGLAYHKALNQANIFILPSLAEGQPISLLDAWAARLPVVVSAVGNNPHMVIDGENGWLVKPGSVEALYQTLTTVLSEKPRWATIGRNGYNLVKRAYSWEEAARQVFAVYQKVIKNKNA